MTLTLGEYHINNFCTARDGQGSKPRFVIFKMTEDEIMLQCVADKSKAIKYLSNLSESEKLYHIVYGIQFYKKGIIVAPDKVIRLKPLVEQFLEILNKRLHTSMWETPAGVSLPHIGKENAENH